MEDVVATVSPNDPLDWYLRAAEMESGSHHDNDYVWNVVIRDAPSERHLKKAESFKEELLERARFEEIDTLAALEARLGNFEKAVEYEQRAIALLLADDEFNDPKMVERFRERLERYQTGKPYTKTP